MRRRRPAHRPTDDGSNLPVVAGYTDLSVIGRGASATVYRATQEGYDREVALKVLHVDVSDRRAQKRFQRERAVNGRLSDHPSVVTVLDSGFVDGRSPYLAMELFERGSLTDRIAESGPLDVALTLHVGVRIAGALESAHRIGVLHRDVKPQNVLLSRYGEPALADFGIAAILEMDHSLTAALTPVHAPPEVLEGSEPTAAADVYALGSTLHTLLTGAPPFVGPPGEGMLAQLLRITTSEPPRIGRSDVPASLVAAIDRALEKSPDDRFPSSEAFGQALQDVQRELGAQVSVLPVELGLGPPAADVRRAEPLAAPPAGAPLPPAEATERGERAVPPPPRPPDRRSGVAAGRPESTAVGGAVDGIPIDEPTVIGRQQGPGFDVPPTERPRWLTPLLVGAAAVIGAAGVWFAIGALGDDDDSAEPTVTATIAPTPTQPLAADALAPIGLTVSTTEDAVLLSWRDRTGGEAPQIVYTYGVGDDPVSQPVEPGAASTVITGVGADEPVCFTVSAVLALGDATTPATTADSEPICINGATAQVVDG